MHGFITMNSTISGINAAPLHLFANKTSIVANVNAIAVASGGANGCSPHRIIGLPDLPGLLAIPSSVQGLVFPEDIGKRELKVPKRRGDLEGHVNSIIEWVLANSVPTPREQQIAEFGNQAMAIALSLRGSFDLHFADPRHERDGVAIIQYVTDLPPPPFRGNAWCTADRIETRAIQEWYGPSRLRKIVDRVFGDVFLPDESYVLIEDCIVRDIRDFSFNGPWSMLCGLPVPTRRPQIQSLMIGGFIADQRVISLEFGSPISLNFLTGYAFADSYVPESSAEAGYCRQPNLQPPVSAFEFEAFADRLVQSNSIKISKARAASLMADLYHGGEVYWADNDEHLEQAPVGFSDLSPEQLLCLAEGLIEATAGPIRPLPNHWAISERHIIRK